MQSWQSSGLSFQEPQDHTRCKAVTGERQLVYAQKTDIRLMSLDLNTISPLVTKTRSSCAIDFHYRLNKIFYTDIITQKIYRYSPIPDE